MMRTVLETSPAPSRVGNDFSFDWITAIDETVKSAQPFNQTARLKDRQMAAAWLQPDDGVGRPRPRLFDECGLYFKPDLSPFPSTSEFLSTSKPKKPKKKKKSKKSDCVVKFTSMKKADTKLLLVRQKPHKVDKKHHSFLIPCDDCEANLLPLDMKIHHKRFHLEVECPDCCCLFIGEQRLSEHICVPKEEDPKAKELRRLCRPRTRRSSSSVSPLSEDGGDACQIIMSGGDELISSARSVSDDEESVNLAEFVMPASATVSTTRPSTPTRIMGSVEYDLGVHFDGIFIPTASPDPKLAPPADVTSKLDSGPSIVNKAIATTNEQQLPLHSCGGINVGHIVDNDYLDLPTP